MKSYVTIALCPICQKENGSLLMDTRLKKGADGRMHTRDTFEMNTVDPRNPCQACREKYLKTGVLLINPDSGRLVVLKTSAFKRIFDIKLPEHHVIFTDDEVLARLQV